jgi:hypothetical protein
MGDPQPSGRALPAGRPRVCLSSAPSDCEARGVDDETSAFRKSFAESRLLCPANLVETGRANLIMAWLQQQLTRERPDTFTQTVDQSEHSKVLATTGRTIHFGGSRPAASPYRATTIFFSLPFSSSSCRSRFISDGVSPLYFLRQL